MVPILFGGSDPLVGDSSHVVVELWSCEPGELWFVSQFLSTPCVMVLAVVSFQSSQESLTASRCLQRVYAQCVFLATP